MISDRTAAAAIHHCRTCPTAVVVTLWPSGSRCVDIARKFIAECGAKIVSEHVVTLPPSAGATRNVIGELLTCAMYDGEEWLESNCWYSEQPLEDLGIGLNRPRGPWAGAKWKAALCFRDDGAPLHVFVLDVASAKRSLWSGKYGARAAMSAHSGNAGNSCMHLTDDQSSAMRRGGRHIDAGAGCNASYAFACARALLNPHSLAFLGSLADELGSLDELTAERMAKYCAWLADVRWEDAPAATTPSVFTAPPPLSV